MISDVNFGLIVFTAKLELGDSFSLLWLCHPHPFPIYQNLFRYLNLCLLDSGIRQLQVESEVRRMGKLVTGGEIAQLQQTGS